MVSSVSAEQKDKFSFQYNLRLTVALNSVSLYLHQSDRYQHYTVAMYFKKT